MCRAKHLTMFPSTLRSIVLPLSLLVSVSAIGARGVLKADGIIRVKGAELSSATITVVPSNAASYVLSVAAKRIVLDLPLDDVYLVSVARVGCPTKEVYFDTRVPAEMHSSEFTFPFQITLEHLTAARMFAYASPVGFVRYVHGLKDFGYETKYVIRVEEELKQRMQAFQETGVDPKRMATIAQARTADRARGEYSAALGAFESMDEGTLAPNVHEVPRQVHVVSGPRQADESPLMREVALAVLAPMITLLRSAPLPERTTVAADVTPIEHATPPVVRSAPAPSSVRMEAAAPAVEVEETKAPVPVAMGGFSRTEETIEEPRRVTRIIRLTEPSGDMEEYRMVSHAFGAVYYFQDSRSITERDFVQAIAK